jgi:tyrosinase
MIDKIWFDWQHLDPANANSFYGGSVQVLQSLEAWQQYPNGGPPFLGVSTSNFLHRRTRFDLFAQPNSTMPADGMFPEVTIGDVMNTTGGYLCYVYQ